MSRRRAHLYAVIRGVQYTCWTPSSISMREIVASMSLRTNLEAKAGSFMKAGPGSK